ncbi:LacI family DNA-binding transcriptional regulator [Paenibacillus tarimensis]
MRVSIKDIAIKCSLSVSTVSRALNGDYGVKDRTRSRVLEAARELGYVPNLAAKELVSQKSRLIGIVLNDSEFEARPAFFELLPHINKTLALYNYRAIICTVNAHSYSKGELPDLLTLRNVSGCIILSAFRAGHPIYEDIKHMNHPAVVFESSVLTRTCSNINTDEIMGAYMATRYLIECGHRRIGFVNGSEHFEISRERLAGFRKAMDEFRLPVSDTQIVWSDYTGGGGKNGVELLLQRHPEITAVFFANDLMAMGAISSLAEIGVLIPEHLSVIGYDGLFICKYYNPPLATVVIDNPALGTKAADMLIELINGSRGKTVRIVPQLFRGKSVKQI